ncbi:MAG: hypothetical protein R3B93_15585 [Bacteroidia bacterium]
MKKTGLSTVTSILFWSVISAAFIGPGTVTTASKAGATYHTELLWALVFQPWPVSSFRKLLHGIPRWVRDSIWEKPLPKNWVAAKTDG